VAVAPRDLLEEGGRNFKRAAELLAKFQPVDRPPGQLGLDAVYPWPHGEIWFSTEVGFLDGRLGPVGDGDRLSDTGRVVARNRELVAPFRPIEEVGDLGLDALQVAHPTASRSFRGCGVLVGGAECVLFRADIGGLCVLANLGSFGPGARVRVSGTVNPNCATICQQAEVCGEGNTIEKCARSVRRHIRSP